MANCIKILLTDVCQQCGWWSVWRDLADTTKFTDDFQLCGVYSFVYYVASNYISN